MNDNELLVELLNESRETEALVKRFLNFAGPLECRPENTNLDKLLKEIVDSFKARAKADNVAISFKPSTAGANSQITDENILIDALLIKQALNNLIENAITACADRKGRIQITSQKEGRQIIISVSDNGRGIPVDELDKIFTPFFSSKPSGTGLGLPLAAKIIDLHRGHIHVESNPGEGTTLRVYLPLDVPVSNPQAVC